MMKKVLIFLVALLGCLYSANATENENKIQEDVQTKKMFRQLKLST